MANANGQATCTCGRCPRCTKVIRAAVRRETRPVAQRSDVGAIVDPRYLPR
jgi:hypothetical protein